MQGANASTWHPVFSAAAAVAFDEALGGSSYSVVTVNEVAAVPGGGVALGVFLDNVTTVNTATFLTQSFVNLKSYAGSSALNATTGIVASGWATAVAGSADATISVTAHFTSDSTLGALGAYNTAEFETALALAVSNATGAPVNLTSLAVLADGTFAATFVGIASMNCANAAFAKGEARLRWLRPHAVPAAEAMHLLSPCLLLLRALPAECMAQRASCGVHGCSGMGIRGTHGSVRRL